MTSRDVPFTRRAVQWLIEPHPAIRDPEDRGRTRLVSTLLLATTLVIILGYFIELSYQGHYRTQLVAGSIGFAAAYLLSRTRHEKVALLAAVVMPAGVIFFNVLASGEHNPDHLNLIMMWLFIPIMLSGLLLSPRTTALISLAILAGVIAFIIFMPGVTLESTGIMTGFVMIVSLMTLVMGEVFQQNTARLKEELGERIRTEAALAASKERWHSVAQTAADAIIIFNSQCNIISWNDAAQAMFGYSEQEVIGKSMAYLLPPDQVGKLSNLIEQMHLEMQAEGHSSPQITLVSTRKDGSQFPGELTVAVWESDRGKYYTGILRDVSERHQIEAELRASLQEKEVMLKEIHHRVKNNLQVISSLLSLQSSTIEDKAAITTLTESQNRVRSMALIHEKLYQSSTLSRINFSEYIQGLTTYLIPAYKPAGQVTFQIESDDVWLSLDAAVPCGLIVNELVSNALKYAFPDGSPGRIELSAHAEGDLIRLVAADDGVGIPAEKDVLDGGTLGLQLVHSLVGQLDGELHISNVQGTRIEITFYDPTGHDPIGGSAASERPGNTASDNSKKHYETTPSH